MYLFIQINSQIIYTHIILLLSSYFVLLSFLWIYLEALPQCTVQTPNADVFIGKCVNCYIVDYFAVFIYKKPSTITSLYKINQYLIQTSKYQYPTVK